MELNIEYIPAKPVQPVYKVKLPLLPLIKHDINPRLSKGQGP